MSELTNADPSAAPSGLRKDLIQRYSTLVVLIAMFAVFAIGVDKFLTPQNLLNIAQQISMLTIVGAGLTFGFAAREMDLSVGFAVGLSGVLVPLLLVQGVARDRDIDADNTIMSTSLAEARIELYGEGVLADKQRPGWLARILDNVWPF